MIRSAASSLLRKNIPLSTSCIQLSRVIAASTTSSTTRFISSSQPVYNSSSEDNSHSLSFNVIPKEDHGEYMEYSVIHTNRSLNLMSQPFQQVMRDLNMLLKETYNAEKVAIMPGSGTFGMEAVARQFATDEHVMVIRNGWFSFRWTEIFDMGKIPASHTLFSKLNPNPPVMIVLMFSMPPIQLMM